MDDDPAQRDDPARHDDQAARSEPARPAPRPDLRVGDADRQAALQALGAHLEAGRLDVDEYGDRSACAAVAVRRAELAALFDDLPAPHPALPERPVPGPPAALPVPVERHVRDRAPAVQGLMIGLVLVMVIALPGLMIAAGAAGMGGGGLLFLPLMLLLVGGGRPGRRRFGPGGPGGPGRGPWHG